MNPEIQDIVKEQLNFTKNNFINAQNIRDMIIENGGTYEEARQAYLDKISIIVLGFLVLFGLYKNPS